MCQCIGSSVYSYTTHFAIAVMISQSQKAHSTHTPHMYYVHIFGWLHNCSLWTPTTFGFMCCTFWFLPNSLPIVQFGSVQRHLALSFHFLAGFWSGHYLVNHLLKAPSTLSIWYCWLVSTTRSVFLFCVCVCIFFAFKISRNIDFEMDQ